MKHSIAQQNQYLRNLGFRFHTANLVQRRNAIKTFQALVGITPDGKYGPATTIQMNHVNQSGGMVSDHFKFLEFACKCPGYAGCPGIKLDPDLVTVAEKVRELYYEDGMKIVSAYRCPTHNKRVGGAKNSQHVQGKAADIEARIKHTEFWPAKIRGLGYNASNKKVRHIDVRDGKRVKWIYG